VRKFLIFPAISILLATTFSCVYAYEAFRGPTELIYWDENKAAEGYTMFTPRGERTYLIDMKGNVVHAWPALPDSHLSEDGILCGGNYTDRNWEGKIVWKWDAIVDAYLEPNLESLPARLWQRGSSRSLRIWSKKLKEYTHIGRGRIVSTTQEDAIAAGCDPAKDYTKAERDALIEVDSKGNIIWFWEYLDHVIQDRNPVWPNYVGKGKTISDYPGKLDLYWKTNAAVFSNSDEGLIRDWNHTNSLDYNEELDHIALNSKHWSEFVVIDHGSTFVSTAEDFASDADAAREANIAAAASDAGDFIYRFGNPSAYQQGVPPSFLNEGDQQIYGAHDIQWIRKGIPGEGNFLLFDNAVYNPKAHHSELVELNPYLDAKKKNTGWYVNPPDAGYDSNNISNQVIWNFKAKLANSFYSRAQSGLQRLPNGNTVVSSSGNGHLFQVTPDGEVVWEYINPVTSNGVKTMVHESDRHGVTRVQWYPPDYPAFKGKDLTPRGTITELAAQGKIAPPSGGGKGGKGGKGSKGGKGALLP